MSILSKIKTSWIVVVVLIVGLFFQHVYFKNRVDNLKQKLDLETKLGSALMDSVSYYENAYGEEVANKLSLQYDLFDLRFKLLNSNSINNQLLDKIDYLNYKNNLISAALIESETIIDSLENSTPIIFDDKIVFKDSTKFLKYFIEIDNVIPSDSIISPLLNINQIKLPNQQFVDFHWKDNKKEGYPVAFSVTNTNPYIKTTDISSYIIPQINKKQINPSTLDKIGNFFNSNGLIAVGATGLIFGTLYILK